MALLRLGGRALLHAIGGHGRVRVGLRLGWSRGRGGSWVDDRRVVLGLRFTATSAWSHDGVGFLGSARSGVDASFTRGERKCGHGKGNR